MAFKNLPPFKSLGDAPEPFVEEMSAPPPVPKQPDTRPDFEMICGAAGSGKTYMMRELAQQHAGWMLAASTGIAAVNLGDAVTINSLLGYYNTASLEDGYTQGWVQGRLRKHRASGLRRIILDEVSMTEARQLTCMVRAIEEVNGIDDFMRGDGGDEDMKIRLSLVGDPLQLGPVEGGFFFESEEWHKFAPNVTRLTEIRRQGDPVFINALRAVREGQGEQAAEVFGPRLESLVDMQFDGPTIMARNEPVDRFNRLRHDQLEGKQTAFVSQRWVKDNVKPPADWKNIPEVLQLKDGALVMILANRRADLDDPTLLYANGDLGIYRGPGGSGTLPYAHVELQRTGEVVEVLPVTRSHERPTGAKGVRKVAYEVLGEVKYMPLRLAYASTIHKCVAAFTRVQIDGSLRPISAVRRGDVERVGGEILAVASTRRRAYRLVTARGYEVVTSADHRWQTPYGWASTRAIAAHIPGTSVAINVGSPVKLPTDAYAWWLGLTVGDANYTHRKEGQIHLACLEESLGDDWATVALQLGAKRVSWRKDRRGLHLTARALRDRLAADGLDYVKAPAKSIPAVIWERGPAAWQSFLRGLFDADGSVGRSYVTLCTASETLGREAQELLLACGIVSMRRRYEGKRDPYWQVRVDAEQIPTFKAIVGFSSQRKGKQLAACNPHRVIKHFNGFDAVVRVDDTRITIPMVDVEVAAPHLVGFGPILGHNSQGLSFDKVQVNITDHFMAAPGMLYVALSRARNLEGLRVVGNAKMLVQRAVVHPKVGAWL